MRLASKTILLLLLASGCATQNREDVIGRVAEALERSQVQGLARHEHRIFPSQLCVCILLPSNTPPAQVATEALKTDPLCSYGSTKALRVRKIRIQSPEYEEAFPGSDPEFTAVLLDTAIGRRIVLLQYHTVPSGSHFFSDIGSGYWEHWTIDPNRLLNEVTGANVGGARRLHPPALWDAHTAQCCRSPTPCTPCVQF